MIGIFDSGRGGIASLKYVRGMLPRVDIAYLADRKNSPYGTKSTAELVCLVCEDIRRLVAFGAEKILIACCTASTVHSFLPTEYRDISIPIISPTAKIAAGLTENGKITVIATQTTVLSGAFGAEIKRINPEASVYSIPCQGLVGLIEGRCEKEALETEILEICEKIDSLGTDTLVLGCTHFSHVRGIFEKNLKTVKTVDSAAIGASVIANEIKTEENGKILYT